MPFELDLVSPELLQQKFRKIHNIWGLFLIFNADVFLTYFCNSSPTFYISTRSLHNKMGPFSSSHSQYQQLRWSPQLALKDFRVSCFGNSVIMIIMMMLIWTYSQYSSLADTFAAVAIAVGTVDMSGITVALIVVLVFSAVLKVSTQFGVFHSLPHRDQGSSDEKDANM